MLVEQEPQATMQATSMRWRGMIKTADMKPILSAPNPPTRGGCMICTGMCGSGARIGMGIIRREVWPILLVRVAARTE